MKKLFLLFLISVPFLTKAQNCNCPDNFKFVVERIKNNYPGYRDKVTPATRQRFDFFTDSLQKAASSADQMTCIEICKEWLSFFKDRHIGINYSAPESATKEDIRNFFAGSEKTAWNETAFKAYLERHKNQLDEIEGIWYNDSYEIGIVKDSVQRQDEFVGFVISANNANWSPGQTKIRIKKTSDNYQLLYFRTIDHSKYHTEFLKTGDKFNLGYYGDWFKRGIQKDNNIHPPTRVTDYSPSFTALDKETNLITLPSFKARYKKATDSLIESNGKLLKNSKHLIIDLRNNSGGLTPNFEKLLPYIYTNPIYTDGGVVWATADNIKDSYGKTYPELSEEVNKSLAEDAKKLKAHLGEFYPLYAADTIKFATVLKNPQRVSILMNRNSASSAEHLILRAEQSKKVTLFGQNSSGAIDYTEIVFTKMPCNYFELGYPAFRSNRLDRRKLDNVGITPNVIIPDSVPDWVEYVRKYKVN